MDYIKEILNVGDDVLSAVTSAIEENDYSNLSADLKTRFRIFEEDLRADIRMRTGESLSGKTGRSGGAYHTGQGTGAGTNPGGQGPDSGSWTAPGAGYGSDAGQDPRRRADSGAYRGPSASSFTQKYGAANAAGSYTYSPKNPRDLYVRGQNKARTPFRQRFFSKAGSITKMVFGIMGMGIFLPASLGTIAMMLTGASSGVISFFTLLPFSAGSVWLTLSGNRKRKLIDLYNRYAELIGPAEYIAIGELADHDGNSEANVRDNIQKLIKSDMLPQGRLDRNQTTLMLTSQAWEQYQAAEKSAMEREEQERGRAAEEERAKSQESPVIREGKEYIQRIHHYNDQIPNREMSEKLSRLESIMQRIFLQVEKDPDSAPDLHKLMNYYLPTTEKLILAYIELDQHPSGSENIDNTRREIEDAVDTVNSAFETLFDDLFQDTAWDISSDISVMKSMMKQDGLMKDPLKTGQ